MRGVTSQKTVISGHFHDYLNVTSVAFIKMSHLSFILAFPCPSYLIWAVKMGAYVDQNYALAERFGITCRNFLDVAIWWCELMGAEFIACGSNPPSRICWYSLAGQGKFERFRLIRQNVFYTSYRKVANLAGILFDFVSGVIEEPVFPTNSSSFVPS
jgi:hypothetical protein